MKKIIVEIVYSGAYPILVQDIQWALQDKTPKESVAVREVLQSEQYLTKDEINMCKLSIAKYQDAGSMSEENEKRWDALWDKLDNMLRSAK